jgi:Flp pilus assembly pilin Flp
MSTRAVRGFARSNGGAAAIEFAIIVWALIFLCLGIIEIGRGLHVRNEMSYAADLAARKILSLSKYSGDDMHMHESCKEKLISDMREAFTGPRPEALVIDLPEDGTFRRIEMRYPFTFVIEQLGAPFDLTVSRRVPMGEGVAAGEDPVCDLTS